MENESRNEISVKIPVDFSKDIALAVKQLLHYLSMRFLYKLYDYKLGVHKTIAWMEQKML